jgi:hypothetical protein
MKKTLTSIMALTLVVAMATMAVFAAIIVDGDGYGFVGKGDVQLGFQWNNAQLQSCADYGTEGCLSFSYAAVESSVSEATWTCSHPTNGNTQERSRTTTISETTGGLISGVARVKKQVTGFNLNGGNLVTVSGSPTTEGPARGSCPTNWTASTVIDTELEGSTSSRSLIITDVRNAATFTATLD